MTKQSLEVVALGPLWRSVQGVHTRAMREGHSAERYVSDMLAALRTPAPSAEPVNTGEEEYMTVTLSTDGTVTSHHSFDADWDEMVAATQKIIDALQERMAGRGHCPFARINADGLTDTGRAEPMAKLASPPSRTSE